jgi:NhaP-type Na+/H+ or K+/H+ antiporter
VTLLLLATNSTLTKTLRYVMAVEVGMRALAAAAAYALWQDGRPWPRRAALALAVTLVAVDQALFQALFARDQVYDPVTWSLARQLGMIPR